MPSKARGQTAGRGMVLFVETFQSGVPCPHVSPCPRPPPILKPKGVFWCDGVPKWVFWGVPKWASKVWEVCKFLVGSRSESLEGSQSEAGTLRRVSDLKIKIVNSDDFMKRRAANFAPRCGARAIWKSKPLNHQGLGPFFLRLAGAGIPWDSDAFGRRRCSWGLQERWQAWWIWRGLETMLAWQARRFPALWQCLGPRALNLWKGCGFGSVT